MVIIAESSRLKVLFLAWKNAVKESSEWGNAFGLGTGRVCWGVNKMDIKWTRVKKRGRCPVL